MQMSAVNKENTILKIDLRGIAEELYGELAKEGLARNQILAVTSHLIEMVAQTIRAENDCVQESKKI